MDRNRHQAAGFPRAHRAQVRLAKAIALLNLVATTGTVRASRQVLTLIDADSATTLDELDSAGIVTYRDFADEYRIWHGTDIDIRGLLDTAHQRVQRQSLAEILSATVPPQPVVAARHSAEHNVLRVFARRYADSGESIEPLDAFSPYDGEVLLVVGEDQTAPTVAQSGNGAKPVVAAIPDDLTELATAAREVAAVTAALDDPTVSDDWVARLELGERLAQSRSTLDSAIVGTFSAEDLHMDPPRRRREHHTPSRTGQRSPVCRGGHWPTPPTPTVRNEMLNRTDLTSQGAKARRLLLKAMIEHGSDPDLGLEGYGPEMAMYRAFLERTGLHGDDKRNDTKIFRTDGPITAPSLGCSRSSFQTSKSPPAQPWRHLCGAALTANRNEGGSRSRLRHGRVTRLRRRDRHLRTRHLQTATHYRDL